MIFNTRSVETILPFYYPHAAATTIDMMSPNTMTSADRTLSTTTFRVNEDPRVGVSAHQQAVLPRLS